MFVAIMQAMTPVDELVKKTTINLNDTQTAFNYRTTEELKFSHLIFRMFKNTKLVNFLSNLTLFALKINLPIQSLIKATVFRQFCGGTTINDCDKTIEKLAKGKVGSILDYSVEAAQKEHDFDKTRDELIKILNKSKNNPNIPFGCLKMTGLVRFSILEKITSGKELNDKEKELYRKALNRLEDVCRTAFNCDTRIFIDAEETWIQEAIDRMAETMMITFNKTKPIVYTTLQMYRNDRIEYLNKLIEMAKTHQFYLGIKFVRGAYLEKENLRAIEMGYKSLMNETKQATDNAFNEALKISVENIQYVAICAGTHNDKSSLYLTELMAQHNISKNDKRIYFSQLFGMSDNISFVLAQHGYNVTKYLPYGPVKFTMPYLIRRAQENTSVAGQTGKELQLISTELKRRRSNG